MGRPRDTEIDVAKTEVTVDGSPLPVEVNVHKIDVTFPIKGIAKANLLVTSKAETKEKNIANSKKFSPGSEIEVLIGYNKDPVKRLFLGIIETAGVKVKGANSYEITIDCKDKANSMTKSRINHAYEDKTDSQIITEVLEKNGVKGKIAATSYMHEKNVQYNTTDWDYCIARAEASARVIVNKNGKVSLEMGGEHGVSTDLTNETNINNIDLNVDLKNQIPTVKATSWDPDKQETIDAEKVSSKIMGAVGEYGPHFDAGRVAQLHSTTKMEKGYLDQWADAKILKHELSMVKGSLNFKGNHETCANSYAKLVDYDGVLKEVYISEVKHSIGDGEWTIEAKIGSDAEDFAATAPNVSSTGAAGLTPSISGSYIGTVLQIYDDPKGENRIKVDIPVISKSAAKGGGEPGETGKIWARIALPYASKEIGFFFMPEVGDEVLVTFLQNDPRYGVITGMLHSKAIPSPYVPDEPNTYKSIVTKTLMKFEFEDVEKIITISTPAGNIVTISEAEKLITLHDQNGNKIEMTEKGINIDSPFDIKIKAEGKIDIEAGKDINIKAGSGIDAKAKTVKAKGSTSIKLEGGTATLKATGQTTVKGLKVNIN